MAGQGRRANARRREGQEIFAELCASAPSVPEDALKSLSLASGARSILEKSLEDGGVKADQSSARTLMMLMVAIGHALGSIGEAANAVSDGLGRIGARGAEAKHTGTRAMKKWALAEAETMKGAGKAVARDLAKALPAEFAQVPTTSSGRSMTP
jgi:hypothetical protein